MKPRFSVIIPTRDRSGPLRQCLRALEQLDYEKDRFEVIVVDDGGAGQDLADELKEGTTIDVRWIRLSENRGPAAARNEGAVNARSGFLAFLDDDCIPESSWLRQLGEVLERTPCLAVGGKVVNGCTRNIYAEVNQTILDEAYWYYNADHAHARFFATMNFAVSAEGFRQVGGFNPEFRTSEDRDFCARWLKHGLPMVYAEGAQVVHQAAPGLREFWNRHYQFGRGAYQYRKLHASGASGRVSLESPGFYLRLLLSPRRRYTGFKALLASGLCGLSQFASALGFWAAHRRQRRSMAPSRC